MADGRHVEKSKNLHNLSKYDCGRKKQRGQRTNPFAVLGDEVERFHLAAERHKPCDVVVADTAEEFHFSSAGGDVSVTARQQRLDHHQRVTVTLVIVVVVVVHSRPRQHHVAVHALACTANQTHVICNHQVAALKVA